MRTVVDGLGDPNSGTPFLVGDALQLRGSGGPELDEEEVELACICVSPRARLNRKSEYSQLHSSCYLENRSNESASP